MGKAQQEWLAAALLARCEYLNLEVGELSAVYTTGSSDSLNIVSENTSFPSVSTVIFAALPSRADYTFNNHTIRESSIKHHLSSEAPRYSCFRE